MPSRVRLHRGAPASSDLPVFPQAHCAASRTRFCPPLDLWAPCGFFSGMRPWRSLRITADARSRCRRSIAPAAARMLVRRVKSCSARGSPRRRRRGRARRGAARTARARVEHQGRRNRQIGARARHVAEELGARISSSRRRRPRTKWDRRPSSRSRRGNPSSSVWNQIIRAGSYLATSRGTAHAKSRWTRNLARAGLGSGVTGSCSAGRGRRTSRRPTRRASCLVGAAWGAVRAASASRAGRDRQPVPAADPRVRSGVGVSAHVHGHGPRAARRPPRRTSSGSQS